MSMSAPMWQGNRTTCATRPPMDASCSSSSPVGAKGLCTCAAVSESRAAASTAARPVLRWCYIVRMARVRLSGSIPCALLWAHIAVCVVLHRHIHSADGKCAATCATVYRRCLEVSRTHRVPSRSRSTVIRLSALVGDQGSGKKGCVSVHSASPSCTSCVGRSCLGNMYTGQATTVWCTAHAFAYGKQTALLTGAAKVRRRRATTSAQGLAQQSQSLAPQGTGLLHQ